MRRGSFVTVSAIALCCSALSIFYVGCNKREREFVISKARKAIHKIKKE